jgi:hypothetical protein
MGGDEQGAHSNLRNDFDESTDTTLSVHLNEKNLTGSFGLI